MTRGIYSIIAAIAIVIISYLLISPQALAPRTLVFVVSALYALLVASIHGFLSHSLSAKQKFNLIIYPLTMGVLFMVLVFIYIYLVLPAIVPGYM